MKRIVKIMLDVENEATELIRRGREQAGFLHNEAAKKCDRLLDDIKEKALQDSAIIHRNIQKQTEEKRQAMRNEYEKRMDAVKNHLQDMENDLIEEARKKLLSFE